MLTEILILILKAVSGILSTLLLVRFFMQWQRISFANPGGRFVITLTDWLVKPFRRIIPGWFGLDFASLIPAWLLHVLVILAGCFLAPMALNPNLAAFLFSLSALGVLELLVAAGWLIFIVVLIAVLASWFAPHSNAPAIYICRTVAGIILRPFRRWIPPFGGLDLSPLVLLLLLQILHVVVQQLMLTLTPLLVA